MLLPFVFAANDELIDDDLGAINEVAELGFPDDKGIWIGDMPEANNVSRRSNWRANFGCNMKPSGKRCSAA